MIQPQNPVSSLQRDKVFMMLHDMMPQLCTLHAGVRAKIATVGLLSRMNMTVSFEARLLCKGLGTYWTLVRLAASVHINVVPHVVFVGSAVFAKGTVVLPGGVVALQWDSISILHQFLKRTKSHEYLSAWWNWISYPSYQYLQPMT